MKNSSAKTFLLGTSLLINTALVGYLVVTHHRRSPIPIEARKKTGSETKPERIASVTGARPGFKRDQLQGCYNALIQRTPEISDGSVHLQFTLDTTGGIENLQLMRSSLGDADFNQCVIDEVKAQRFPASTHLAGQTISHKFNFHRKDPTQLDFTR